ncbi:Xaa-Pro aminopeptidase [Thalassotalea litorea]|uniref:Xaa-Pro aminopeptidase n=1 Tax=Thalassotalea litorea TaxID=2020715 RepID=A0A5R9ITZ9_9GAMM|nr:Xaa-Pro aminopeptidase [Thalassotalea litorea]TLU66821.1 Xaa-Pro aminopeptidase [Thalassotalea litorea]
MNKTHIDVAEFQQRRYRLLAQMPANSVALIPAAKEVTRSRDTEFLFCQDKDFFYLSGFHEPDALLVLVKGDSADTPEKVAANLDVNESILFCRDKDPQAEIWHGRRIGPEVAQSEYGVQHTYGLSELEQVMPMYVNGRSSLYFAQGQDKVFDDMVFAILDILRNGAKQGFSAPGTLQDIRPIVAEMRLLKSDAELAIMRSANEISGNAHQRAMKFCQPGKFEYQVEAEILHEFASNGARTAAYGSIVGGGENATILHYTDNQDVLLDGELLLIDAGAELCGYAADITRTFPVSGKFSSEQAALYNLVLESQNAAIATIKPGSNFAAANDAANQVLTKGLHQLGILQGSLEQLLEENACKQYFIHGLGHWLGLDVHDVGDYQMDENRRQLRPFEPGMVMTIEPGIYIDAEAQVEERWKGIGIRIEDNILVTESGYENLTVNAAKTVEEIESLMATANKA